jgi:CDP-paratose 2-epimerase
MPKALITGSSGLVGSQCTMLLCELGWDVVGLDNDSRGQFFGPAGSVAPRLERLCAELPRYHHHAVDIRDRAAVRDLVKKERPDFVIHTAAQPSHDRARAIP